MTQGMAAELCEDNISVNALSPSTQIWVGGTVYVAQTQRPDFDKIDLTGKRKDGSPLKPPMGFPLYAKMTEGDLNAVVAYLRTVPAQE
mgnify:CR=1 FL=1